MQLAPRRVSIQVTLSSDEEEINKKHQITRLLNIVHFEFIEFKFHNIGVEKKISVILILSPLNLCTLFIDNGMCQIIFNLFILIHNILGFILYLFINIYLYYIYIYIRII